MNVAFGGGCCALNFGKQMNAQTNGANNPALNFQGSTATSEPKFGSFLGGLLEAPKSSLAPRTAPRPMDSGRSFDRLA